MFAASAPALLLLTFGLPPELRALTAVLRRRLSPDPFLRCPGARPSPSGQRPRGGVIPAAVVVTAPGGRVDRRCRRLRGGPGVFRALRNGEVLGQSGLVVVRERQVVLPFPPLCIAFSGVLLFLGEFR